jgi:uncharacterized protein
MNQENIIEVRFLELRASQDSRQIAGTAIVFNSLSENLGNFKETIKKEAITQELINNSNIVMLYNHNDSVGVLARSNKGKGSLKIKLTEKGVDFEFTAKNTSLGNEVLESVRNGDLSACSFAFRCAVGGDVWEKQTDGTYLRTINKIDLIKDLSIVVDPAYTATSCDLRGLKELQALEEREDKPVDQEDQTIDNEDDKVDSELLDQIKQLISLNTQLLSSVNQLIEIEKQEELQEQEDEKQEVIDENKSCEKKEDSCDDIVEDPEDPDEEIRKYYSELKNNIRSINIK